MKVQIIGGFLGAGKTTAIRALARVLHARGERVAVVTNDQGEALVDTTLCAADGLAVAEIPDGCFCCRYDKLEEALLEAEWTGATIALAEAVGSCTDLVATVLSPLISRRGTTFEVLPLSVLVDSARFDELEIGAFSDDVRYLFLKQIEEADVVVLTKSDRGGPDVEKTVRAIRPGAAVVRISATTGAGLEAWLDAKPDELAKPLDIDYDRYAAAEAELGWFNGKVEIEAGAPIAFASVFERFLGALSDVAVTHVKLASLEPSGAVANLVKKGGRAFIETSGVDGEASKASLVVNARAALAPNLLENKLKEAMHDAVGGRAHAWSFVTCFQPSRPVPTYRHAIRCTGPGDECCPE